ncbi:MAG: hypothetical protein ACLQVJ_12640 [Syntrophobacteraceae bacterium]
MKKLLFSIVVFCVASMPILTLAWRGDDYNESYDRQGQPNYRYRRYSGKEYQYDLSKPQDRIRYETDPSAQIRDEINVDPRIELDRELGQYGGGAKP